MTKKELLKQLHNLNEQIKPDAGWKSGNREILLSQIKAQTSDAPADNKILWHVVLAQKFAVAAYKPLGVMILILGVALGGYIMTVGATKNSLPGDFLYPIKLTSERMQVNLAANDEKKANLEITFAERRMEELQKVSAKAKSDSSQKDNLQVSLQKYQESINNVKNSLSKLEKTDTNVAIKVAKLVDEKAKGYVDILNQQQDANPDLSQTADTAAAITVSKAVGEQALDVIITEFQAGNSQISMDEVYQKLDDMTKGLADTIDKDKAQLEQILANKKIASSFASADAKALADKKASEDKDATANTEVKTETATPVAETNVNAAPATQTPVEVQNQEVLPTLDELKNKIRDAENILSQARDALVARKIVSAYTKAKQANDILTVVEKVLAANSQYLDKPKEEAPAQPAEKAEPAVQPEVNGNVNAAPEVKK